MKQEIRFCPTDGGRIAYAMVGSGPPLTMGGWWVSHLELDWARPDFRAFVEALATRRTVIRYDSLGCGLSDRPGAARRGLEPEVATLAAVLEAAGVERTALLGVSSGGCVAAALAARRPELVEALVLYGSYPYGPDVASAAVRESLVSVVRAHWGLGSRVLADVFLPAASSADLDEFARFQREAADAETAAANLSVVYETDVREELPRVAARTLVLHRRDDRAIPYALGREAATLVPGARLVTLDGADHLPWRGDAAGIVGAVGEFLDGSRTAMPGIEPSGSRSSSEVVPPVLSGRELEVLRLIAAGLSDAEVAERLVLSPHTVHRHVANIRNKLRQPSRTAAVAQAARLGLI